MRAVGVNSNTADCSKLRAGKDSQALTGMKTAAVERIANCRFIELDELTIKKSLNLAVVTKMTNCISLNRLKEIWVRFDFGKNVTD